MIKLDQDYSEFTDMSDEDYPEGKAIDASTEESFDGTPILARLINDLNSAHIAMYEKAYGNRLGISGKPDTQKSSQFADAVAKYVDDRDKAHADKRGLTDGVHGATSKAVAGQIMSRDGYGRSKVGAPEEDDDIARKLEVDAVQANLESFKSTLGTAAGKTAGSAAGNVPLVGTALGTTDKNIVVTDTAGKLKPSGTVLGSAAGKTAGSAAGNVPVINSTSGLGTTDKNILVTDTNGNLKASGTVLGSAAGKTAGSAAGNVPLVGTALGTTDKNIVVTDTAGKLKPSGTVLGSAAGKTAGSAAGNVPVINSTSGLGTTDKNILVTDTNGNLKASGTVLGSAAGKTAGSAVGNVPLVGTALGTTDKNIVVTGISGQLKPAGVTLDGIKKAANAGGICTTSVSDPAKIVSIPNFYLYTGAIVTVMFKNGNNYENPTLNVNSTGAKPIMVVRMGTLNVPYNISGMWRYTSGALNKSSEMWQPYTTMDFIYDGTNWVIVGNPTVESGRVNFHSGIINCVYEVKADGLITQTMELATFGTSESMEQKVDFPIEFKNTPCMVQTFVDGVDSRPFYREFARAISKTQFKRNGYYAQQLIAMGY